MHKRSLSCLNIFTVLFLMMGASQALPAQKLPLPPRAHDALSGSAFKNQVENLSVEDREAQIYQQIMSGNVPAFMRDLAPISFSKTMRDSTYEVTYYVLPDYMAVGSDSDYFLMPMTPILAQKIANALHFTLPTKQMVDQIWSQASVKLSPSPIAASPQMTTIPVMWQHNSMVKAQRAESLEAHPLGALVAGDKKDVIISNKIYGNSSRRVVIYGWHYTNGNPIQPVYAGHAATYADYSHGIRLVRDSVLINNKMHRITDVLQDASKAALFSDEGVIRKPYYPLGETEELKAPGEFGVTSKDSTTALIPIKEDSSANSYRVSVSSDGLTFLEAESGGPAPLVLTDLSSNDITFIKLQAISGTDTSAYSEVLSVAPAQPKNNILVVNGFDRATAGNTYDFIRQHGQALHANGYSFDSATNEAVSEQLIALDNYKVVVWILGTESTKDETFSMKEQQAVASYLRQGGSLMVSGAEIAWDLDHRGSTADQAFMHQYLKTAYSLDAPDNKSGTYYRTEPATGSIFEGISSIPFDDGTKGSYNVEYPDVLTPATDAKTALIYSGVANEQAAGVQFKGMFAGGNQPGKLVYLGFPFETIYPPSARAEVMRRIMLFMESEATSISNKEEIPVKGISLKQNYPNPFNPTTTINYTLYTAKHVVLTVFNSLGQKVATLVDAFKPGGTYSVRWDAAQFSSGMYFYRLTTPDGTLTRKMLLVK
jgi:hypothetical protein